jgi:hypothetical protein
MMRGELKVGSSPLRSWLNRAGLGLHTVGFAVVVLICRAPVLTSPIDRDIATYAIIGNGLLNGHRLYSQLWDHKPPAIHITYAGAIAALGERSFMIYCLSAAAAIIPLVGLSGAAVALSGSQKVAFWTSAAWAATSGLLLLEGDMPNTEMFVNASVVIGVWIGLEAIEKPSRRAPIVSGILFLVATLYKQIAVVVPLALILVLLARPGKAGRAWVIRTGLMWLTVGIAGWCLVASYFAVTGRAADFYEAVFKYNQFYAGSMQRNVLHGLRPDKLFPSYFNFAGLLLGLFIAGSAAARSWRHRGWWLLGAYLVAGAVMVALPGRSFPHYWLLFLPPLCLAFGWGVDAVALAQPRLTWVSRAVATGVLIAIALPDAVLLVLPASRRVAYQGHGDLETIRRVARGIRGSLPASCDFFEVGSETQLYFYAGRQPPSDVFYFLPLQGGPVAGKLEARVMRDLQEKPPCLMVVNSSVVVPGQMRKFIEAKYEPMKLSVLLADRRERLDFFLLKAAYTADISTSLIMRMQTP